MGLGFGLGLGLERVRVGVRVRARVRVRVRVWFRVRVRRELCRPAQAAAGEAGELLLLVGVGARAASLRLALESAARALGGSRLLLLALDEQAAPQPNLL